MRLERLSLHDPRFLVQFHAILDRFHESIPWIGELSNLRNVTDSKTLAAQILDRLGMNPSEITPYQFSYDGAFIGGLLCFTKTPTTQRFQDPNIIEVAQHLERAGAYFITCLIVQPQLQGRGIGTSIMQMTIRILLDSHTPLWGVVSRVELLHWYERLGGAISGTPFNRDGLAIVSWGA